MGIFVIFESVRIALSALWANKMRALLTMLGVIIGVSSVIVMIAIVQGARQKVIAQVESNGSNQIFCFYNPKPGSIQRGGFGGIRMGDVLAVEKECKLIGPVSPTASTSVEVSSGANRKQVSLIGVLAAYTAVNNIDVAEGRFVSATDDATWSKACVIGQKVRNELFGAVDPIGKRLICSSNGSHVALTVAGVLAQKDRAFDTDFDNSVFASLRSVQQRFTGNDNLNGFNTKSLDASQTLPAADEVWRVFRHRHPLNVDDFVIDTQAGLLKQLDTFISIFQLVLGGVAGLSLLTGGIGIMNIMLVSVTERTREIGIRKAVGAKRRDILAQFVVEAVVVSGMGGMIGVGIACGIAALVNTFAGGAIKAFVPTWSIGLGLGFSVGVGVFFGIYPAFRASKLDPIVALRYE